MGEFLTRTHRVLLPYTLVPGRPTFTPPGAELRRFYGHQEGVSSVAVLADGRSVLSASADRTLRLWDLETGAELRRFEGHEDWVLSVTVLADRHTLSGSHDRTLRLWNLETGTELARLTFDAVTTALAWSPKQRRAVVGDVRGGVHVIDLIE
jgi:WD40 repeat protein